jgi:Tol biopolymer transport system component
MWAWAAASVLAVALGGAFILRPRPVPSAPPMMLEFASREPAGRIGQILVSPDGESILFRENTASGPKLRVRSLSGGGEKEIYAGLSEPRAWSPDSQSVLFLAKGKLMRADLAGGDLRIVCENPEATAGVAWSGKDVVFIGRRGGPIERVAISGGSPSPLMPLDKDRKETSQRGPVMLPDGRLLYESFSEDLQRNGLYVVAAEGNEKPVRMDLKSEDNRFEYIHPNQLLILDGARRVIVRAFAASGETSDSGAPQLISESVAPGSYSYSASRDGRVIALIREAEDPMELALFDHTGRKGVVLSPAPSGGASHIEVSPDGRRLLFQRLGDVWIMEIDRGTAFRLTLSADDESTASWSASGDKVFFYSFRRRNTRDNGSGIYEIPSHGSQPEKLIAPIAAHHMHASADGRSLIFERSAGSGGSELWVLPLGEGRDAQPLLTGGAYSEPRFSPDSRFFSYDSEETGRREVYIQTFPPGGGKWRVSTDGGSSARWRGDGKEVYFLSGGRMMAAAIEVRGGVVRVGRPREMFSIAMVRQNNFAYYGVSPDGRHFAMNVPDTRVAVRPVTLLLNWRLADP